jgi:apolipoprotein N-acyltransferase
MYLTVWKKYHPETLPFLSALVLILSFPPWDKGYLAWISLLPLFLYCRKQSSYRKSFWGGFSTGIIFFLYLYAYMALSVNFVLPRYVGILVVITSALYSAFFYGIFSLLLSFFLRGTRTLISFLAIPSAWVLLEYSRSLGFLGHTGGFLGYSQNYNPLLQCISFYGYWGLPFLMVLFQAILFFSWCSLREGNKKACGRAAVLSLLIFMTMLGSGIYFPSLFPVEEKDNAFRIALVQGNIPQENILDPSMSTNNFLKYLELSRKAHALYAPLDLIVWPETIFSTTVARHYPAAEKEIATLAEESGASILFGAMYDDKSKGEVFNSILLHESSRPSKEKQRYDKVRLVPFAEYFPFPDILNSLWNLNLSLGTYTAGIDIQTFQMEGFDFGGIVCFESYFSRPALSIPQKGGEHIFVLTNDAWFLDSNGLEQHARAAAIRALETGLGVTQVANTGHTISFDYAGREILKLPALSEGIALLETRMPKRQTLYLLWGDYFLYFCLFILVAAFMELRGHLTKLTKLSLGDENFLSNLKETLGGLRPRKIGTKGLRKKNRKHQKTLKFSMVSP